MKMQHSGVFAVAASRIHAEQIVERLRGLRIPGSDVSLLLPVRRAIHPAQSASLSAAHGIAVSGALGWIRGLEAVSLQNGEGLVAGGPVLECLGNPQTPQVADVLEAMGVAEADAQRLEDELSSGNVVVGVRSDDPARLRQARNLFQRVGASGLAWAPAGGVPAGDDSKKALGFPRFA
jgi:hypothetical protein